jgi:parallel beta-helix repeat protein
MITGFTLLNYYNNYQSYGVYAFDSEYLTFKNNIVIGCDYGLQLSFFSNCTIENNEILNGTVGISTYHISSSSFINNTFINNKCAVKLNSAKNNLISRNSLTNNGMSIVSHSYPNTFIENTVNNKPFLYFENENDLVIENTSVGQLYLIGCMNITVKNINVSNATNGIGIIRTDNCLITKSNFHSNCYSGISFLEMCKNNTISYNDISYNNVGIGYNSLHNNSFIGNKLQFNKKGMDLTGSKNTIKDNIIKNNNEGIEVSLGSNNVISNNIIANCTNIGLNLYDTSKCLIKENNFLNNNKHAFFEKYSIKRNYFRNNYWDSSVSFIIKIIFGLQNIFAGYDRWGIPTYFEIPWAQFDWRPAPEPYDIGV